MFSLILGIIFIIIGIGLLCIKLEKIGISCSLNIVKTVISSIVLIIGASILITGTFFIADSDKSYVVQWPTGQLYTHFEPGIKIKAFGSVFPYDRVIAVATPTFVAEKGNKNKDGDGKKDLDALEEESNTVTGTLPPPLVRFTDAAKGNAYGIIRVALPIDRTGLLKIHRELGSTEALVNNVLKNVFRSAAIASARLMSIQDYITKRGSDFDEFFSDQISGGLYKTTVKERIISKVVPTEADKTSIKGEEINKDNSKVDEKGRTIEEVVEIVENNGIFIRQGINDIERYGLKVITAKITYLNPEDRVIKLIGDQRDAEARAALAENKRRASLLEAEAEEAEGQKQVAKVRATELASKEQIIIQEDAKKAATLIQAQKKLEQARLDKQEIIVQEEAKKEAILIQAQRNLEEAELNKQTAKVKSEEAEFKKKELILIGQGEAEKKALIMKADGALKQKLETYENVMGKFAESFSQQKWVPEVQMNGSGGSSGNEAANLINLLTAKTLKDLGLNMDIDNSPLLR